MKYTLFFLAFLAFVQVIFAQTEAVALGEDDMEIDEDKLVDMERYGKCLVPTLTGTLVDSYKTYDCPYGKPFGWEFKVAFDNNVDHFQFIVNICRRKHKPQLPKKIFKCALRRAIKQCKTIGLPKCVTDHYQFLYRWKLVNDCLAKVLRRCSNGKVSSH